MLSFSAIDNVTISNLNVRAGYERVLTVLITAAAALPVCEVGAERCGIFPSRTGDPLSWFEHGVAHTS